MLLTLRIAFLLLLGLLPLRADEPTAPDTSATAQKSSATLELATRNGIPVARLEGTPAEIGAAMGRLVAEQVDSLWKRYMKPISDISGGPERLIAESLKMDAHLPERFREEMKAFAKAANISYGKILTTNAFPDIYRKGACSSFAASGAATRDGKPLLARNLDFFGNGVLEKTSIVIVFKPKGRKSFVSVTWPGFSGVLSGMNSDGLCCAVMEVRLGKVTTDGIPSTLLFRHVLEEASTLDEALTILEESVKVAGNNLIIIDRQGRAAVAELGPGLFRVRRAEDGMVYSTNHHRKKLPTILRCGRYKRFETFAEEKAGAIDPAALKKILHSVNQEMITLQSMIFEPAALRIHLATGMTPSSKAEYKVLDFSEDLIDD